MLLLLIEENQKLGGLTFVKSIIELTSRRVDVGTERHIDPQTQTHTQNVNIM
jgi:hypothetical protein